MHLRLVIFALLAGSFAAQADPLEELKAVSGLEALDARKLQAGEIVSERGTKGNFSRGVYVEACFYLKAPLATTGEFLLHWNPTQEKGTDVTQYLFYPWPTPAETFRTFQPKPGRAADKFLIDATAAAAAHGTPGELHLTPAEAALLRAPNGWARILTKRSDAMAAGGLGAVPDYTAGDVTISAQREFRSLLKMTPAIAAHFTPLIEDKTLRSGGPAAAEEVVPYAEESEVRSHTSWCLGVMGAHKTGAGWQVYDCTYYAADTYFLTVSLYQLWPWANGTLVWQVGYISAPFRPWLIRADKVFAGREMVKDNLKSIQTLRHQLEQQTR